MQPTLQTFIGVFVNNLGIKYSMNVWSGIRDPGNFKIPDVHDVHLAALIFNLPPILLYFPEMMHKLT